MRALCAQKRHFQKGFTLLEVMIALSIMVVAFAAILTSQSGSIYLTIKTKEMNVAGWLAHNKMVESEHLLEGKPFSEIKKEMSIEKFPSPFEHYSWKREIKEIAFPDLVQPSKDGQGVPEPVRILGKTITKFLNNAVREMTITVSWEKPGGTQKLELSTYLVDLNAEFNFEI